MKRYIKNNDIDDLAKLVHYPCRFHKRNLAIKLKNKKQFKKRYSEIFTPFMKYRILQATLENIFVNCQGFMIGNGELWFDPRTGIMTFNVPVPEEYAIETLSPLEKELLYCEKKPQKQKK